MAAMTATKLQNGHGDDECRPTDNPPRATPMIPLLVIGEPVSARPLEFQLDRIDPQFLQETQDSQDLDMPQAACCAALKIQEILEIVILYLDQQTILVTASRVCRLWLDTIAHSPRIQQALYFQPISPLAASPVGAPATMNPLLKQKFGDMFFDRGEEKPRILRADAFWRLPWSPHEQHLAGPARPDVPRTAEPGDQRTAFVRKSASWRRMLISQPPVSHLGFAWMERSPQVGNSRMTVGKIHPTAEKMGSGITMGQLYDLVFYHLTKFDHYEMMFSITRKSMLDPRHYSRAAAHLDFEETYVVVEFHLDSPIMRDVIERLRSVIDRSMDATRRVFKSEGYLSPAGQGSNG